MRSPAGAHYEPIEADLAEVTRRLEAAADVEHPFLRLSLEQVLRTPGKRIRPVLTLACGKLFRAPTAPLYAMAAAVEFLHSATLIHDDVVDQTGSRRGLPSLYTQVGNSVSILVGDYLFAQAASTASETNNLRIMRLFAESVMTLCAGQVTEASRGFDEQCWLDRDAYYRTIEAKTAALFVLACHAGAIIGEGPTAATEALRRYGRALGLAFQIVDDILDLVGDEAELGKPVGSDLRQGVVTLPVIYLRDELPERTLSEAFAGDGGREAAIQAITGAAPGSRAIARAREEAGQLASEAASALEEVPPGACRDLLYELTRVVVERDR